MTLVAIYHNPPTPFSPTPSVNSKWKRWFSRKKKLTKSPTTLAAATEKVLCQEQPVKCEDLTAKEFAQMAGIKIKSSSFSSTSSLSDQEFTCKSDLMLSQMTSISTRTATSSKSCHHIWDSDFWQTNTQHDTLFISRLCSREAAKNNNLTVPGVIQKGRFQIVVGQDDCCEPVNQYHHVVLEWKRKRSDSSSTNTTKKK
ncbi:hypothetical protein A0J61_06738 [Choanephora cucurbitarum]|uniref:Uncharacterized protein n=1 Tax=Choanephora cucurbitarum TaxID=101091 RepID=A0A1C7N837_9FUNG|nr:hypothetical protein A0J61_06738 [Choanephora cucurbitarum]